MRARHILISFNQQTTGDSAKSARDQARDAEEKEKQEQALDEIGLRSHAIVPDSFQGTAPTPTPSSSQNNPGK